VEWTNVHLLISPLYDNELRLTPTLDPPNPMSWNAFLSSPVAG
jgi:hypothetical protein